jgi:radical SAM superfamily enzyme YgiQ (UPF0313 family)
MTHCDIAIAGVPFVDTNRPLLAPAALKSVLEKNGFRSMCIDLNSEILAKINYHPDRKKFLDFFYQQTISDEIVDELARMINYCADKILSFSAPVVGLSLFSYDCQVFTAWLASAIKEKNPECKIVIGGPGIRITTDKLDFVDSMLNYGYIDDFIVGDGEYALIEYLKGNKDYPGINSPVWNQNVNLDQLPDPNFDDYSFYWYNEPSIPIVDSRGCVRNCEFCDVIEIWKDYQYTTADRTFEQMVRQYKKYNINHFDFRSSISNGNLREFKKLMTLIAEYNQGKFRSEQFSWEGSFIVRSETQHNQELWETIAKTNATLFLGVESIVESVRIQLGKNFTNQDLDYHLEMTKKHNIKINLLFIAAYHSETQQDYEEVLQWFRDRKHYANAPITAVRVSELGILPYTTLGKNLEHHGITMVGSLSNWYSHKTKISPGERQQYFGKLCHTITHECGFSLSA